MAGNKDQKLKLLYLMKIFNELTDEDHRLTAADLIDRLNEYGVVCERKSIYTDIDRLREFGLDILYSGESPRGYYCISDGGFELPELKLLVDAVQSSRFITRKKSEELIHKLERLTNRNHAAELRRQLHMLGVSKSTNESVYYTVDTLYEAIAKNLQVEFNYFDYDMDKQNVLRHGGEKYVVSPYAMIWDNENYYLAAYHARYGGIATFRVDKMCSARVTGLAREKQKEYAHFDPAGQAKQRFSMFGGEEMSVRLEFDKDLVGVVMDRFGDDVDIRKSTPDSFCVRVSAQVSPVFYSWLFQFGGRVKILSPDKLKDSYREYIKNVLELYD